MKVFTNNMMPSNIHTAVIESTNGQYSNDVFIRWYMEDELPKRRLCDSDEEYEEEVEYFEEYRQHSWIVTEWLLTQGCEYGDVVIVEHMW